MWFVNPPSFPLSQTLLNLEGDKLRSGQPASQPKVAIRVIAKARLFSFFLSFSHSHSFLRSPIFFFFFFFILLSASSCSPTRTTPP